MLDSTTGTLTDASGAVWALKNSDNSTGMIAVRNGTPDTRTAWIVLLRLSDAGIIFQRNRDGGWWSDQAGAWIDAHDPTTIPLPAPTGKTGPVANSSFATVDFGALTGNTVPAGLWGLAAAAPNDNNFAMLGDEAFLSAMAQIMPKLYRLNCNSGGAAGYWTDNIFRNPDAPDFSSMQLWFANAHRFISPDAQVVVGIRIDGRSPSQAGKMAAAMVAAFRNTKGGDGKTLPLTAIEVGNENDQMPITQYTDLFNAASAAVHAINPTIAMVGTVDSYIHSDRMNYLGSKGSGLGWACFHAYAYCKPGDPIPSDDQLLTNGRAAADVQTCSQALAGTPAAKVPVFLGEYNQECAAMGEPRQQQPIGAVFAANWLISAVQTGVPMAGAALWEAALDGDYGAVQAGGRIAPIGFFMGKAGQTLFGPEVRVSLANGSTLTAMAVRRADGGSAVLLSNRSASAAPSGVVALSRWPGSATGDGAINCWTLSDSAPAGSVKGLKVVGGLTTPITVPAKGMVLLYT